MRKNDLFGKCLEKKKIVKFSNSYKLIKKELETAEHDLIKAKENLKLSDGFKWATVQAYYSMFHTARAMLYKKGYREKSHICLIYSMYQFYVKDNLIPNELIDNFLIAKRLREDADYENEFSEESAKSLIENAEKFFTICRELLEK